MSSPTRQGILPWKLLAVALLLGLAVREGRAEQTAKWEWEGVPRIVAMGDVHGYLDKLTAILQGTGIIDAELEWSGGSDHVVLCGDLVDRGPDDREILDFLQRLQKDAERAGGRVHALIGNHGQMNLVRDFRFVSAESYRDFYRDERPREREAIFRVFAQFSQDIPEEEKRSVFDQQFPPGYFAHQDAFGKDGKYGSWLAKQPIIVKINGIVFLHGGLTPEVAALGLDEINRRFHDSIPLIFDAIEVLAPVVAGVPNYVNLAGAALYIIQNEEKLKEGDPEAKPLPESLVDAARTFLEQTQTTPFLPDGPLWYRGNSLNTEADEAARFERVLELLDARAVMIGHTSTPTPMVTTRFGGRLFRGDVGMGSGRPPRAVVFRGDEALVYDPATNTYQAPQVERPEGTGSLAGDVDATAEPDKVTQD